MEPFKLNPGESIIWARREADGGITVRLRFPTGWEDTLDVYPDQDAPEVAAWLRDNDQEARS